jgi:hypothetical protein
MGFQLRLTEEMSVVECLSPAADAGGRTGAYVTLKNCHKAYVVFHITQGNAATIQCSVNQAQDTSGTGAKAIPAVPIFTNLDEATSDALTSQTAAANYTTDAAIKHKYVIFEIDPDALDLANGFKDIAGVTGASNAANITECTFWLYNRYKGANWPTNVVD